MENYSNGYEKAFFVITMDWFDQTLEKKIHNYVDSCTYFFTKNFLVDGRCYVIKYLPSSRLESFLCGGKKLYASNIPGYTWGDGVYVAPLSLPLSTMMYGRAGIVGHIEPKTVFDATQPTGITLYQAWIRRQWAVYRRLTTTMHADQANRTLRNRFRSRFNIDCVIFRPDQDCHGFVRPHTDYWLAVTHWNKPTPPKRVWSGFADCVKEPEWCVLCAEDFEMSKDPKYFTNHIGRAVRKSPIAGITLASTPTIKSADILANYKKRLTNPKEPILCYPF